MRLPGLMAAHARSAVLLIAVLGALAGPLAPARAQAPAAGVPTRPAGEEMILTVRSNGVDRGEYTLLRMPDGDFWLPAQDVPRLQVKATEAAQRYTPRSSVAPANAA